MKQETLEDLLNKKAEQSSKVDLDAYANGLDDGAKWQQEQFKNESIANYIDRHIVEALVETAKQERSYSEEDIRNAIDYGAELGLLEDIGNSFEWTRKKDLWFEQFKKK